MQVFTSLLAVSALLGSVAVAVLYLLRHRWTFAGDVVHLAADAGLWIAAIVAVVATLGSLYFSEVAHYYPCQLCWFQRIAMYPLAVILVVAAIRRDRSVRWYAGPIAAIGLAISTYHYLIEWKPSLEGGACGIGPSCADIWFRQFRFVTLAFMAAAGFIAILVFAVLVPRAQESSS